MNYKIAALAFSGTVLLSGCASMTQQGRIGKNDGSDPCYRYLESIDSVAMYYKDERLKQLMTGAAVGTAAGAGLGAGVAALTNGNLAVGAIVGGIAGGVTGAFVANSYWDNRMQQANQQASQAAVTVANDLREDIAKISSIDSNISGLVRCRTQRRDEIRKQYAEKRLTEQQAQLEWQKWADQVKKDQSEMQYLGEALNNIQKIEESYNYAATMIEPGNSVSSAHTEPVEEVAVKEDLTSKKSKKTKVKQKGKHKNKATKSGSKNSLAKKSASMKKPDAKSGKITTLVSSMHEKYESIQKNKSAFDKLAVEANNSKGFEHIESRLTPFNERPFSPVFISASINTIFDLNDIVFQQPTTNIFYLKNHNFKEKIIL